jgi:replicative DNA helicase
MSTDRAGDLIGHMIARPERAFDVDPSLIPENLRPIHAAIVELQSTTRDVTPSAIVELIGGDARQAHWLGDRALSYHGSFAGALASVTKAATRARMTRVAVELRAAADDSTDPDAAITAAIDALSQHGSSGLTPIADYRTRRLETLTTATFCVRIDGAESVPLAEGDFVVIGARPGVGKTVLALQSAVRWASEIPVGFFSFEMAGEQLFDRIVAGRLALTVGSLRRGVSDATRGHVADATRDMEGLALSIDDSAPTFEAMVLACRAFAARGGRVVIIDYFGLATGSVKWEVMAQSSKDLKRLARQTGLVVIALSQLSRDVAKESRRPTIADLRGTGSLEQDADTVAVMGKPDDALLDEWRAARYLLPDDVAFIDFAKSRHSVPGCYPLHFCGDEQRFKPVDQEGGL